MSIALQPVVAAVHEIFDMGQLERVIALAEGSTNVQLTRNLNRLRETGAQRFLVKPTKVAALDGLYVRCPNFSAVVDDLRRYLALALDSAGPLKMLPLLLAGDPGVGKTYFARCLAKALGTDATFVSMGGMTGGFELGGSAPTWNGAKVGKIAAQFLWGTVANPLVTLDEVDKTGGDSRYDPFSTLLQLLEPDTARHFRDEFLDLEFDCSQVLWVATANDLGAIPEYILSRMAVFEIKAPSAQQARAIAVQVYEALLQENGFRFDPAPSDDVLDALADVAPREMKKRLLQAMGEAKLDGRSALVPTDVRNTRPAGRQPIGF